VTQCIYVCCTFTLTLQALRGNMFTHHQKTVIVDAPLQLDHMQPGQGRPTRAPVQRPAADPGKGGSSLLTRAGSMMWGGRR
jgi:hypothetical protein